MKKGYVIAMCFALALSMSGCKKKVSQESTDAINLDTLETTTTTSIDPNAPVSTIPNISLDATTPQGVSALSSEMAIAPTSGAPTNQAIQTALKNAGYYSGSVDGKLGPKSKAAVKEFQAANGLTADGKVGAKTWIKLSAYLGQSASTISTPVTTATSPLAEQVTTERKTKRSVDESPSFE